MLLAGDQEVAGSITFLGDIWLDGSSYVSGLIDGVDVSALEADAVFVTGNQTISGMDCREGKGRERIGVRFGLWFNVGS